METYFQLLNTTYFALLVVFLSNWTFILWVVHQLGFHNPLSMWNASGQRSDGGKQKDRKTSQMRTAWETIIRVTRKVSRWGRNQQGMWETDNRNVKHDINGTGSAHRHIMAHHGATGCWSLRCRTTDTQHMAEYQAPGWLSDLTSCWSLLSKAVTDPWPCYLI